MVKGANVRKLDLTGLAQLNSRDNSSDQEMVAYDYEYIQNQPLLFDIRIIFLEY